MIFKYASLALIFISSLARAQNFTVTQQLQRNPVTLSEVAVSLDSQRIAKDASGHPVAVGSQATLTLKAKYEAQWCMVDGLFIHIAKDQSIKSPDLGGDFEVFGTFRTKATQKLEVTAPLCGGGSVGYVTIPLTVTVQSWSAIGQTQQFWLYKLNAAQKLVVLFDINSGWGIALQ